MPRTRSHFRSVPLLALVTLTAALPLGSRADAPAPAHKPHMPRNAFLLWPVTTTKELIAELKAEPKVRKRYASLFKMEVEDVIPTLSNLHPMHLKKALPNQEVWFCKRADTPLPEKETPLRGLCYNTFDHTEQMGNRAKEVKQGTFVFALPNGHPVLIQECGNPLRHDAPPPVVKPSNMALLDGMMPTDPLSLTGSEGMPLAYVTMPGLVGRGSAGEGGLGLTSENSPEAGEFDPLTVAPGPTFMPLSGPTRGNAALWGWLFPGLFAPLFGGGGGGGGTSVSPLPPPTPLAAAFSRPPTFFSVPASTPEPGTETLLAALALCGLTLLARRRR